MAGVTRPILTAPLFDAHFDPGKSQPVAKLEQPVEQLWGRKAIANALGVSVDMVVSLARSPDCPIYRPAGRYFAYWSELGTWLRTKPGA